MRYQQSSSSAEGFREFGVVSAREMPAAGPKPAGGG
jgi:hypothetical protein